MKKNILNKIYLITGFFLIYIASLIFVSNTSNNSSYKNPNNLIHKVSAELKFYQSTLNNKYEKDLWSSENYPLQSVYKKVKVTLTGEPAPASSVINTVNVTRRSH